MSLDQETILQQQDLLAAHRRTLAALLQQQALLGGVAYASPGTLNGVEEARANISRIKAILREAGVQLDDEPNDEAPPQIQPIETQLASGDTVNGDKVAGDKVLGDKRVVKTAGGDYAEGDIDKRQGAFIGEQHNYFQPSTTPLDRQQQRNRRAMLAKVKAIWIDGLLEQSLAKELRIALDLSTQPDAVNLPLNALVQELRRPAYSLPSGTPTIKVFEHMAGALLILGAPGAGKTTLLLELARDLIVRAEQDEGHPIPVVFNLSSWASKRQPLKEWLVEELNTKYDVPRKLAQSWMEMDVVLPLLDGLDEVAVEQRAACVTAINAYRQEHGLVPLAVCSRVADYEALEGHLRLQGAVVVQPLTPTQIDGYLDLAGAKLVGVRAALRSDPELGEMLNTPLMLSIVALAYAGKAEAEVQAVGTPEARRHHLFDAYTAVMFQRRGKLERVTPQQATQRLAWLAHQLVVRSQTIYYIERMQPDWLPRRQRTTYTIEVCFLVVLLGILLTGLAGGLLIGLFTGLGIGLKVGLIDELFGKPTIDNIEVVETLKWSWFGTRSDTFAGLVVGIGSGVVLGPLLGLVIGAGIELIVGLRSWFVLGPVVGLAVGLVGGFVAGMVGGLSSDELKAKTASNQGIRRSARNGIAVGLIGSAGLGLPFGLYNLMLHQGGDLGFALAAGLIVGLDYGGRAVLQHYTLRWMLYHNGSLPLRLVPFLDYCAERIFLRKVGGGYIFVHRLLMEHFASLYDTRENCNPK